MTRDVKPPTKARPDSDTCATRAQRVLHESHHLYSQLEGPVMPEHAACRFVERRDETKRRYPNPPEARVCSRNVKAHQASGP